MWAMTKRDGMRCDEFAWLAAELALGVLTGRDRAEAIEHLDRCDACREHVRQLTLTGEELLGLLPADDPPPGFETRVLDRLGLAPPRLGPVSRVRRRLAIMHVRRMLAFAAVALAVIASGLGGWGLRAVTSSPARPMLRSAALVTLAHQTVGEIFLDDQNGGGPRWLYMSVDLAARGDGPENRTVACQLLGKDGQVITLGWFRLADGQGSWKSPGPVSHGPFTGARLVGSDGTVLATASFPATR
jgi:hypothetical protein